MTVGGQLADAIKRHRRLHRAARKARLAIGHLVPPRSYPGIPGRVHFNDFMFVNNSPQEVASYAERARTLVHDKYAHGEELASWRASALPVAIDLTPSNPIG